MNIHTSRPESHRGDSGPLVFRGGGGSLKWAVASLGTYTPSKNPRQVL
jgi:hypothetical protein